MTRDREDAPELAPDEAVERYLRRRRADATESSVYAWRYRLKLFVEWCEEEGIETVAELRGYDLDEYFEVRSAAASPSTLEGEMYTMKSFIEYLEDIEAVEDGLADRVRIPDVDKGDRADETALRTEAALPLLTFYRNSDIHYGTRNHAFLELAWHTGARQGGLRTIDLRDVSINDAYVEFTHRPDTGTPLKNKRDGERPVALPSAVIDAVGSFIRTDRYDVHDEYGRQPLLASRSGRPGPDTVRVWSYLATEPCLHSPCPHGKERDTCEWARYAHASKCPSSRSPHQIRTGSITWQLNIGIPPDVVAERVNATLDVIEEHYDTASPRDRMERRRRPHIDKMDLNHDNGTQTD